MKILLKAHDNAHMSLMVRMLEYLGHEVTDGPADVCLVDRDVAARILDQYPDACVVLLPSRCREVFAKPALVLQLIESLRLISASPAECGSPV